MHNKGKNIAKMFILPKQSTDLIQQLSKYQQPLFTAVKKITLNFVWHEKRPQRAKIIFKKKKKSGGIIIPDFKLYYKGVVNKSVENWHKNRHIDQ